MAAVCSAKLVWQHALITCYLYYNVWFLSVSLSLSLQSKSHVCPLYLSLFSFTISFQFIFIPLFELMCHTTIKSFPFPLTKLTPIFLLTKILFFSITFFAHLNMILYVLFCIFCLISYGKLLAENV